MRAAELDFGAAFEVAFEAGQILGDERCLYFELARSSRSRQPGAGQFLTLLLF